MERVIVNENSIEPDAYGRENFRLLLKFLSIIRDKGYYKIRDVIRNAAISQGPGFLL